MKKFLVAIMFGLMAIAAQAEATFEQIEGLIQQQNYSAAAAGLEVIIQNHPKSAKAFYAMAQAQAGMGNLEKAQKALNIATGLNPTLDFAPASSVASLKQAITPQVKKIESIEETHTVRNTILVIFVLALGVVVYMVYRRNKDAEEEAELSEKLASQAERYAKQQEDARTAREALDKAEAERVAKEQAAEAALKAHKNYGKPGFDPSNPDKLKTKAQLKKEADEAARVEAEREARTQRLRAEAAEENARMYRTAASQVAPTQTVVHQSSGNDMLTGVLIGNMLSGSHHDHHDTTIVRETVREVPAPSRSSSWDDTPAPSKSSSWDDDSSSKSSSSWSSSSDSSSSSSWDSGSSSSDSSSSSSWD